MTKCRVRWDRAAGTWEISHATCGWIHHTSHYRLAQLLARGHTCAARPT